MKPRHLLLAASAAAALATLAPSAFAATYVATFTGDQVVPPAGYPATATASFELTPGTNKFKGEVKVTALLGTSSITVKAGKAGCGSNDPLFATNLTVASGGTKVIPIDITLLPDQASALQAGTLYLELATNGIATAQSRGQLHLLGGAGECAIDKATTIDYTAKLDGAQVTSGTGAAFTGAAAIKLNPESDILHGHITLEGKTPAEAAMGVAACGVNNAFTDVDLKVSAHDGVIDFAAKFSDARQKELAEGKLYLHVFDDANGKVRGQVYPVGSAEQCPKAAGGAGGAAGASAGGSGGAVATGGAAGSGTAGSGAAGNGTAGNGTAGSGTAGSGTAGSGTAGSGTAGSGTAGNGTGGSGAAGAGTAGASAGGTSAGGSAAGGAATGGSSASAGSSAAAGQAGASAGAAGKAGATAGAAGKAGSNASAPAATTDDGGCSVGSGAGGSASLCLLGLAALCAFTRRRRQR